MSSEQNIPLLTGTKRESNKETSMSTGWKMIILGVVCLIIIIAIIVGFVFIVVKFFKSMREGMNHIA